MTLDLKRLRERFTEQRRYEHAISGGLPSPGLVDCKDVLAALDEIDRLKAALREAIDLAQHAIANLDTQHDEGPASNAYSAVVRLAQLAKEAE